MPSRVSLSKLALLATMLPAIVATGWCGAIALAVEPSTSDTRIERLIGELAADNYQTRAAATSELHQLGLAALPLLDAAQRGEPLERQYRASEIAQAIRASVAYEQFDTFAALPDEALDVEQGLCLIAGILDPRVRAEDVSKQLDAIAAQVQAKLGRAVKANSVAPEKAVAALCEVLFVDLKFADNEMDYSNPDNSSIERVLATRKGLPILLGQVTVCVARRLEIPIVGMPVPGPYLVKYDGGRAPGGRRVDDIYFDPYKQGRSIARAELIAKYPTYTLDGSAPPGAQRSTLIRVLNNLRSALADRDDQREQAALVELLSERLQAYEATATP
ncbi:MAG TPA: transglutaminase-like domain-containing protein [Pirellulaceae bacterium]|nr:transglutaminase-like domain-containing protein [Pirellulaceae bacterium]